MADPNTPGFDLESHEDRLPWLEPAQEEVVTDGGNGGVRRLLGLLLLGLVALGLLGGAFWWFQRPAGRGEIIAAPADPYKTVPATDGAKQFDGEGSESLAASEGIEPAGAVDPNQQPEAPMVTPAAPAAAPAPANPGFASSPAKVEAPAAPAAKAPAPVSAPKPVPKPAAVAAPVAKAPAPAPTAPAPKVVQAPKPAPAPTPAPTPAPVASASGGIQLGAFASEAAAQRAWQTMAGRYSYLSGLSHNVSPLTANGRTVYRLRASGAGAADACAKLRSAGQSCMAVR